MTKFLLIAAGLSVLCKWALGKWPWDYLKGPATRGQAVFNARKLLAVSATADRKEIEAAHRRLVAMVHPDKGGTNAQVHDANDARDLLLDELPHEGSNPQ
ncbi:MAG: J domain-containing protein [Pontixanthobacter sp.]